MTDTAAGTRIARENAREFHTRRARQELDLAYRAHCRTAMEAHFRLSSLHMDGLRRAKTEPFVRRDTSSFGTKTGFVAGQAGESVRDGREVEAISS